ncbi:MAG: hypothetical protein ACAH89_05190 [Rariglobus sp.]|nr:HEAT repeat domain-containing protein [Rariglobus sp.]
MKRISTLLFCFASLVVHATDNLPLDQSYSAKEHAPSGAKVTLRLPTSVMIGEEIPAALVVENIGATPFEISTGGDYRSTGYPQRIKVRVRDSSGEQLPELPREAIGFGGGGLIGFTPPILPGKNKEVEFPLECYVSFRKPGIYHITAGHDLGWLVEPDHPHPFATATLRVTEPNATEARAYVDKLFISRPPVPADADYISGYEHDFEKQLSVLRHSAYLPALIERAQAGSAAAVAGIGHVATPDATSALIHLLDHSSSKVIIAASRQLLRRLPSFENPTEGARPGWTWSTYQIDPLLPITWNSRFQDDVMKAAVKLLAHPEVEVITVSALIIEARGGPDQAPAVLAALQKALDVYHPPRTGPDANTLDAPKPQQALIHALDALRQRGWRTQGGGSAEAIAWFRQLADPTIPSPADDSWKESVVVWIENGPAALRMAALQAIPQPMPDAYEQALLRALEDRDLGVQRVACEMAGKSHRSRFARPLVQIVETAPESFLQNAAVNAARECGARYELWQALAAVIPNEKQMVYALSTLVEGTVDLPKSRGGGGNSGFTRDQRFAIRDAWRTFLARNQEALAAGKRVPLTDSETIEALVGLNFRPDSPAVEVRFPDGTAWPPRPKK